MTIATETTEVRHPELRSRTRTMYNRLRLRDEMYRTHPMMHHARNDHQRITANTHWMPTETSDVIFRIIFV
jgi:hypothetical protein